MLNSAPVIMDKNRGKEAIVYQMQLPFNRVYLDKNIPYELLSKAPNPKGVKNHWKCSSKAENQLLDYITEQFRRSPFYGGKRFHKAKYQPILGTILANLLNAYVWDKQLIYSRSTKGDNKLWVKCFDFLIDLQLVHSVIAPQNEGGGVKSWASALPELVNLLNQYKTRIVFKDNHPALEVRDDDKKVLPIPERKTDLLKFNRMARVAYEHNQLWLNHSVTLDNKIVVPFLVRKCNNNLDSGGRFYGDYQRMPSADRAKFKIDSTPTVELDYKYQHMAILYAWEGLELKTDPYILEGFERNTVKAVTLKLVNINNLSHLKASITLSANPDNKATFKAYKEARKLYELRKDKGLICTPPTKPKWIDSFMENIPTDTNAEKLLEAFAVRHSAIWHHIGTENIGLRLQAADSQIMALVISSLINEGIPCLPVHDSVIVKQTDKAKTLMTMRIAFTEKTGKHCLIDQK